jgi:hypothetical protein
MVDKLNAHLKHFLVERCEESFGGFGKIETAICEEIPQLLQKKQ